MEADGPVSENDDGPFEWVLWRDTAEVGRSAIPPDMVQTRRSMRWLSFNGRDANKPRERHQYVDWLHPVMAPQV